MMTIEMIRAEVMRRLDEETTHHADGIKPHELRNSILPGVVPLLANAVRDVNAEAERLIIDVADKMRRTRRASMEKNIEYILDAFRESEDAAYIDPMMDQSYPIGSEDGQTKTLRYWTEPDFQTSARMAYRKSAEAVAAARLHDERMQAAVYSMRARGVDTFGGASVNAAPTGP